MGRRRDAELYLPVLRRGARLRRVDRRDQLPLLRQPLDRPRPPVRRAETGLYHPLPPQQGRRRRRPQKALPEKAPSAQGLFRAEPYRADPGRLRPVLALQRQRRGRRHLQMYPVDDPPRGRLRRDRHAALPCPPRRLRHVRKDPRRRLEQNAGRKYGLHRAVRLSGPQALLQRVSAGLPGRSIRRERRRERFPRRYPL